MSTRNEIHDFEYSDMFVVCTNCLFLFPWQLQRPERGRMRVHHINNVNRALQLLEDNYQVSSTFSRDFGPNVQRYLGKNLLRRCGSEDRLFAVCRKGTASWASVQMSESD